MIKLVKQIKQNLFDGYDNDCWDKTGSVLKPSCKPILLSTQFHKPI